MDARTRRRCAALAVFEPLLGEAELMDALWLCEDRMGGESVTDILRYVDLVGERHGIDTTVRKRLYGELHAALRRPEGDLPLDPWPVMLALRPTAAAGGRPQPAPEPATPTPATATAPWSAQAGGGARSPSVGLADTGAAPTRPALTPVPRPVAPVSTWSGSLDAPTWPAAAFGPGLTAVPVPAPSPMAAEATATTAARSDVTDTVAGAAPVAATAVAAGSGPAAHAGSTAAPPTEPGVDDDPSVPAVQRVFADIVDAMHAEVSQAHAGALEDWVQACTAQLGAPLQDTPGRAALASLGPTVDRAQRRLAWRLTRSTADLSALLTGVYVSLCEALGPVAADQVLSRAVRTAEQRPAAREFPPRRLL